MEALKASEEFLKTWGLRIRHDRKIFSKDYLCASTIESRFRQLKAAVESKESKAIWFMRGGYGSIHLLPMLKKIRPPKTPKLLLGLSDVTSLYIYMNQVWGWPCLHAPLFDRLGAGPWKEKWMRELRRVVDGEFPEVQFKKLKPLNDSARRERSLIGEMTGGNLVTASSTLATPFQIETRGKILFFEEVGERGYRIDRFFYQWEQAGLFKGVKAIVFGDFLGGDEPKGGNKIKSVLKEFSLNTRIPVLSGVESGHGVVQRPVPFGTKAKLQLGEKPSLVVSTGVET